MVSLAIIALMIPPDKMVLLHQDVIINLFLLQFAKEHRHQAVPFQGELGTTLGKTSASIKEQERLPYIRRLRVVSELSF